MRYYSIAGINLGLDMPEVPYVTRRMSGYEVTGCAVDYTVTLCIDGFIRKPDCKVIQRQYYKNFAISDEGGYVIYEVLETIESLASMICFSKDMKTVRAYIKDIEYMGAVDIGTRCHSLLNEIFRYLVIDAGGLTFHSSAIENGGRAILFSADSGTGKSTHTGLWCRYYPETVVINDDSPVIMPEKSGGFRVYGSPWSGKTELNANVSAPLRAIVFLDRGAPSIRHVSDNGAFMKMVRQSFVTPYVSFFIRYLGIAEKLYKNAEMYNMTCEISRESVDIVKDYLEKENEEKSKLHG